MSRSESPPGKSLFIKNISDEIRVTDLKNVFGKYGTVSDVYIPVDYYTRRPRGFAYVQFEDQKDAKEALYNVNGMKLYGRELQVEFAQGDRKTPYEMRRKEKSSFLNHRHNGRHVSRSRSRDRGTSHRHRSRSRSPHRSNSRRSRSHSGHRRHHHEQHHHRRQSEHEASSRQSPRLRHHSRHDSSHRLSSRRDHRKGDSYSGANRSRNSTRSRSQSPADNRVNGCNASGDKGRREAHE